METVAMKVNEVGSDTQWSRARVASAFREIAIARVVSAALGDRHITRMTEAFFHGGRCRVHTIWDLADRSLWQHVQHYRSMSDDLMRTIMQGICTGFPG